mgnify:CR=1 FL=1
MSNLTTNDTQLFVGIDVGSTTTKIVAINPEKHEILLSNYKRHNAAQAQSVQDALAFFEDKFPNARIRLALTGSGAKHLKPLAAAIFRRLLPIPSPSRRNITMWEPPSNWAVRMQR